MAYLIPSNVRTKAGVHAAIRRTADALTIGLGDDATVWYEPPYSKNENCPDFVVLLPDCGIFVIEVLTARSSQLLGAFRGQLHIEVDGAEQSAPAPLAEAERLARELTETIRACTDLRDLGIRVHAIAALPNVRRDEAEEKRLPQAMSIDRCLIKEDIDAAIDGDARSMATFFRSVVGAHEGMGADATQQRMLRGLIHPDTVITRHPAAGHSRQISVFRTPPVDRQIMVMDREQEDIAKTIGDGHRIVRGVAGSGKTLILIHRARLLSELYPDMRILVTYFTKSLNAYFGRQLKDYRNVEVRNIDSVMARAIHSAGSEHPGYDHGSDGHEIVATVALEAQRHRAGPRYGAVLLDEAQDLGVNALRFVVGLLESENDGLLVAADAAQNVFRRSFSWGDAGIQARGRTRVLRRNYRNTREILEFASLFLMTDDHRRWENTPDDEDTTAFISPEVAVRSGPVPTVKAVKDGHAELEAIIGTCTEWLSEVGTPEAIAVLCWSKHTADSILRMLRNQEIRTDPLTGDANANAARTPDAPVVVSTIHSAKGLQFPRVVLADIPTGGDTGDPRLLTYVGMTRAMHQLVVVVRASHPLLPSLKDAAPTLPD